MARKKKNHLSAVAGRSAGQAPAAMPEKPAKSPQTKILGLVLLLVTVALFGPACWYGFVDYDDNIFITENRHVQGGFTPANIVWAFSNNDAYLWHPVTWFSHMLDFKLYGMKAAGHHVTAVLIHAASALLLFSTLRRMTGAVWRSAIVAALFAWHPAHVESVAWISERKDVLSCFFWMLTIWSYVRYVEQPGWARYAQVMWWFALGLMSKPMVVTLPCVLLLLDVWPLRRIRFDADASGRVVLSWADIWRLVREKIPMFVLIVGVSIITVRMMKSAGALTSTVTLPLADRFANALTAYVRYLAEIFWPVDLSIFYPFPSSFPVWQVAGAAALLLGISVLALRVWREHGYVTMGWFWFLGTMVPTIGLVQNGNQSMADRYTYIPYVGAFIALVWGVGALVERRPQFKKMSSTATVAALGACLILTSVQVRYWRSTMALFTHSLQVTQNNFIAHTILADALVGQGKFEDAAGHYREALRIFPHLVQAQNNLGNVLLLLGKGAESAEVYRRALELKPDFAEAHAGLGSALVSQGNSIEAEVHYRKALEYKPDFAEAHLGLGTALVNQGKAVEAAAQFRAALPEMANYDDLHAGLGMALAIQGQYPEAEQELRQALKLKNTSAAHNALGNVLVLRNLPAEAAGHYRAALESNPDWLPPLNSLARLLAMSGDPKVRDGAAAVKLAQRACELTRYENPTYLDTLAAAYAEAGRFDEAAAMAQKGIVLTVASGQAELYQQLQQRLALYRNRQPFHVGGP